MKILIDIDKKQVTIDNNFPLYLLKSTINNLHSLFKDDQDWIVNKYEQESFKDIKKQFHYYENNG